MTAGEEAYATGFGEAEAGGEAPGARLVRLLKESGFRPTGTWDAFELAFIGELPSSDGARRFARLVFPKDASGRAPVTPSSVLITVQHNIPADDVAGMAAALGDEDAARALMHALAPHVAGPAGRASGAVDMPSPPVAGATAVCVNCGMRVASWGMVRGATVCTVCLAGPTGRAGGSRSRPGARSTKHAPTASSKRGSASAGAKR